MTDHASTSPSLAGPGHHFDVIVCGAGPSGCVVAGRLAENPDLRVLLIEAGGDDDVPEVMMPSQWPLNLASARDWSFMGEPNPHLNDRAMPLSMGKVLGGGSSINVMVWARGHRNDWEDFAEATGNPKWGYESVLEIYRRIETYQGKADPLRRGTEGPVYVAPASDDQPAARALVEAARAHGLPVFDDPNGEMMEGRGGCAVNDLIVRDGKRSSIYRAYVHGRRGRGNLTVLTDTMVSRLLLRGTRVIGVEAIRAGRRERFLADREVVLSMGAIQTPKVLMQSGIGPEAELRRHRIPIVQHLPGVGENHQDHVACGVIFEYREPLPVRFGGSEVTLYWSTAAEQRLPDLFHCQLEFPVPSAEVACMGVPAHGWTMFAGLAHPQSRGRVTLSGADVNDVPIIAPNTLSHPDDLRTAIASIELARALGGHAAFANVAVREALPGKLDATAMAQYVRNAAVTYWHQSCTAKMGRDAMSVVDGQLNVYGMQGLRIADASVMPHVTSGNTMAPCVVIGERAADEIRAAHGV
ncbi:MULTISPECIES: GMC family oxidoreductase [unclassified Cupriavidus]|uniref:GMC family oxidoreductase n=1 Tax=Cupriavidus sp. H19C3 TaxID=3241603 RepID=UPI003BF8FDCD